MQGKVYLIGAGPGDAGLLTCKGKWVLERADVVVYDALVGAAVLSQIPPGARRIDVGKRAGKHSCSQEEIDRILLDEALAGHTVARLQGGDPFLFGRGGEELVLLAQNGVPFEIVPGVTSALSAPAYAGIPVTHRDHSASVHIYTAHRKAGTALDLDYPALAKLGGTLVFLMGVSALKELCRGLLDAGMDPDTPAAVVHRGSTADQAKAVSTLAALPEAAKALTAPSVIVIGPVCALAERFSWAEQRPLAGLRFLLTRPRRRGSQLTERLRALGAEAVELPAVSTEPLPDASLDELWESHWLVFTSPSGAELFFDLLQRRGLDVRRLSGLQIAALGQGTAARLRRFGLLADLVPETYDAISLGEALADKLHAGDRVFLARAKEGSTALVEKLGAVPGVEVIDRAIYETIPLPPVLDPLPLLDERTWPVFTSASTVRSFAAMVGGAEHLQGVHALCIGPQTAAQAQRYGMSVKIAAQASMDALVELALSLKTRV